jgi:hypothetical protein
MGYAYCRTNFHTITVYSITIVTFTPVYNMEVNSSFGKIEKFSGRLGTIFLREFKATFSTVVRELKFTLIKPRHSHSHKWPVMCIMRHWMSTNNIL